MQDLKKQNIVLYFKIIKICVLKKKKKNAYYYIEALYSDAEKEK